MQQLRLQGSCRVFLKLGGYFCSREPSLAWSDGKAQPTLFGNAGPYPAPAAGCRLLAAQLLAALLYLPFMAGCSPYNSICSEAKVGDGWEMSGGAELTAPARTSVEITVGSGNIPGLTLCKVKCKVKQLGLKRRKGVF